jgi:hypothetical protein
MNIPSLECYNLVGKLARQDFFPNINTITPNLTIFQQFNQILFDIFNQI